jgi:hypothetical protein
MIIIHLIVLLLNYFSDVPGQVPEITVSDPNGTHI